MFIVHCTYTADQHVYCGSVHETSEAAWAAAKELAESMTYGEGSTVEKTERGYDANFYNEAQDYEDWVTVHVVEGNEFFGEI